VISAVMLMTNQQGVNMKKPLIAAFSLLALVNKFQHKKKRQPKLPFHSSGRSA
jgi:hypothetical protein